MAQAVQKRRDSNLELFRVIVMLSIIAHHYVVNSGIWGAIQADEPTTSALFYYLFGMWGKTGINCFVLITGWFMCTSQITLRKFLKLLLEIEFYRIGIGIIFLLVGKERFTLNWILNVLPVRSIKTGFVSAFLMFWLFIPFLNILIKNLSRKQHLALIALLLFLYTFLATIPRFSVTMNYVSWFCTLYMCSSFMRLYDFKFKDNLKAWAALSGICIVLSIVSVVILLFRGKGFYPYWFISDSNKIMALLTAICLFNFFRTLKVPYCKFVNFLGVTTFGVLLIHAHSDVMRQWLWNDVFDNVGHLYSPFYAFRAVAIVLIVFAVCAFIDYLRIVLLERPLFAYYDRLEEKAKWRENA